MRNKNILIFLQKTLNEQFPEILLDLSGVGI
jgi:hypothetical protein